MLNISGDFQLVFNNEVLMEGSTLSNSDLKSNTINYNDYYKLVFVSEDGKEMVDYVKKSEIDIDNLPDVIHGMKYKFEMSK